VDLCFPLAFVAAGREFWQTKWVCRRPIARVPNPFPPSLLPNLPPPTLRRAARDRARSADRRDLSPRVSATGKRTGAASIFKESMPIRPLSPHLSVYKFKYTLATSILNRLTGIALSFALLLLAYWLMSVASGTLAQ